MRRARSVIHSGFRWFVLRVEGSFEKRAALMLETYGRSGKVPDFDLIKRIWVPQITVRTLKSDGSVKFRRVSALPGYLLLEAILTHRLYTALQRSDLPHVFGWLRYGSCWPSEVPFSDIRVLYRLDLADQFESVRTTSFEVGEYVTLPSLGISGEILVASRTRLVVEVALFKQSVPIQVHQGLFSEVVRSTRP